MAGTACQQQLEAADDSTSPVGDADREEHCYSAGFSFFSFRPKSQLIEWCHPH